MIEQNLSSDQDNWQPIPIQQENSMFNKIHIKFLNEEMNKNLQHVLSVPIYYNDDDIDPEQKPAEPQKYQSLYDPLQDDQNNRWINNKLHNQTQKPLTCPSCFSQLAFDYKKLKYNQLFQHNNKQQIAVSYLVSQPFNVIVQQTKIIRNKNAPQTLQTKHNNNNKQKSHKIIQNYISINSNYAHLQTQSVNTNDQDFEYKKDLDKLLMSREQQINVKIVCSCICGANIGYYDVNKAAYALINVI